MKKFTLLYLTLSCVLFAGCTSGLDDDLSPNKETAVNTGGLSQKISKEDAVNIADKVLKKNATRSGVYDYPAFDYILKDKSTRSTNSLPDTLAYVLNYPNDGGFVIVASDRRVYPVLAFSDEGEFTFTNESAKENFIDRIGAYMETADPDLSFEIGKNDFTSYEHVDPIVKISLEQRTPWDRYVIKEHPGCPVGCVAVATALVMSHSKVELTYHGTTLHLKSIVEAIYNGQNPQTENASENRIVGNYSSGQPEYTYEQGVDLMAKLLYWIGPDVGMKYSTDYGSSASSSDAYNLIKSLNFTVTSDFDDYNIQEIVYHLQNNCIIYLRGADYEQKAGHAWVCDGYHTIPCINPADHTLDRGPFLHCNWGWGGYCDGYYSGDVFSADKYNFGHMTYFSVMRGWRNYFE